MLAGRKSNKEVLGSLVAMYNLMAQLLVHKLVLSMNRVRIKVSHANVALAYLQSNSKGSWFSAHTSVLERQASHLGTYHRKTFIKNFSLIYVDLQQTWARRINRNGNPVQRITNSWRRNITAQSQLKLALIETYIWIFIVSQLSIHHWYIWKNYINLGGKPPKIYVNHKGLFISTRTTLKLRLMRP